MRPRNPLRGRRFCWRIPWVAKLEPGLVMVGEGAQELKFAAFNARRDSDNQAVLSLANQWRAAGVTSVRHRRLGKASVLIVQSKEILDDEIRARKRGLSSLPPRHLRKSEAL